MPPPSGGGGGGPQAGEAFAPGQDLQAQVTDLKHRIELMKVTTKMEVKDLGQQMDQMREATRLKVAEHAQRAETWRETTKQELAELERRLEAQVERALLAARQELREGLRRTSESSGLELTEMSQRLEGAREAARRDAAELAQRLESQQASLRQERAEQSRRLELAHETAQQQLVDLGQRLETTRDTVLQELADLGQRPIFQFYETMLEAARQELSELSQQLASLREDAGVREASQKDLAARLASFGDRLEAQRKTVKLELAELAQRPFFEFLEKGQEIARNEALAIIERLEARKLEEDAHYTEDPRLAVVERCLRDWLSMELASSNVTGKGLQIWLSGELTALRFADESLLEQLVAQGCELKRQIEELSAVPGRGKLAEGNPFLEPAHGTDGTGGSGSCGNLVDARC